MRKSTKALVWAAFGYTVVRGLQLAHQNDELKARISVLRPAVEAALELLEDGLKTYDIVLKRDPNSPLVSNAYHFVEIEVDGESVSLGEWVALDELDDTLVAIRFKALV